MSELTVNAPALRFALDVEPGIDVETWRLSVPAKGACYALLDGGGRPILLGTAASLRAALVGRLGERADDEPTKRADYRAVTRRVVWRLAHSRFERDWLYLEHARAMFPKTLSSMIRRWRAHWVSVEPDAEHPRFVASRQPKAGAESFGPMPTAQSSRAAVEALEDLFDLCRYHDVLVQSPHGQACAYKEMGKCPAPCDGSVPLDEYRAQVGAALAFCRDPEAGVAGFEQQMRRAADGLRFELAGALKAKLDRAAVFRGEALAQWRSCDALRFACLQRGSRKGAARVFVVTPGRIAFAGEVQPKQIEPQLDWLAQRLPRWLDDAPLRLDAAGQQRLGLVAWHLLRGDRQPGVYIGRDQCGEPAQLHAALDTLGGRTDSPDESAEQASDEASD